MPRKKSKRVRLPKPKLPDEILEAIDDHDFYISVKVEMDSSVNFRDCRKLGKLIKGTILFNYFYDIEVEIGSIEAWRSYSSEPEEVLDLAQDSGDYIYDSFVWLVNQQRDFDVYELLNFYSPLLLESVKVEPEWKGRGFALPAVATFLDLVDADFVFLQPHPIDKGWTSQAELKKEVRVLTRFWKKLGFEDCKKKWKSRAYIAGCWKCPDWLEGV